MASIDDSAIIAGLAQFAGVDRRFQITEAVAVGDATCTLVDDYGHHPTEVGAVIATVRAQWPDKRLVMAYQPHRYSRTRDLFEDFVQVLGKVDELVLLDVYSAGEAAIAGADGRALSQAIRQRGSLSPTFAETPDDGYELLGAVCQDDDVLLVQGAGNVSQISRRLKGEAC